MKNPDIDIAIIGAGPAGLTAALYAGRAQLSTRVFECQTSGGQVTLTELIENFPGVYRMNSWDWIDTLKKQVQELKTVTLEESRCARSITKSSDQSSFIVRVHNADQDHDEDLVCRSVILATGASPKRLGIPGEDRLTGRGVSYCGTCDGPLFQAKEVMVIGGGDTAIEEALYLTRYASSVTIIHRRDSLRAAALLAQRAGENPKIRFCWQSVPAEILGDKKVEGIRIRSVKDGSQRDLPCEGVFVFIGHVPATELVCGMADRDERGFVLTDEFMRTSVKGLFAAGDCRLRPFYQIVTACAEGAVAAHSAIGFLES